MAMRISGLYSGLDTDEMVSSLMSAYSTKKNNLVKEQTKLSWTQDVWKDMNSKIYDFYSKTLSNATGIVYEKMNIRSALHRTNVRHNRCMQTEPRRDHVKQPVPGLLHHHADDRPACQSRSYRRCR